MTDQTRRLFLLACAVELALLGIAIIGGWLFGVSVLESVQLNIADAGVGVLATAPLLALFSRVLHAQRGPLAEIRLFLDNIVRPAFSSWTILDLALISVLAGLAEESLFRGLIQRSLVHGLGHGPALLVASIIFGLAHCVNRPYAVVASVIGAYLGLIFIATGNLLAPIVTHGFYDFAALVYFLRFRRA